MENKFVGGADSWQHNKQLSRDEVVKGEYAALIEDAMGVLMSVCHGASRKAGWYTDIETGLPKKRNIPEMLFLINSEITEAGEGYRKDLMDVHLPHRKMVEVELADAIIRIADLAAYLGCDLGPAILEKLVYNANRPDHKAENRKGKNGKKF